MYNHFSLKKSHIPVACFYWSLFVNIYIVNYSQTCLNRTLNKSKSCINRTFNKPQCSMSLLIFPVKAEQLSIPNTKLCSI